MSSSKHSNEAGFTLVEMLVVVGIMGVLAAVGGLQIIMSRASMQGDGGMRVILSQMRMAREMAITQRRYMRVNFVAPNTVEIVREDVPGPGTSLIGTQTMEGGVRFTVMGGVPDTPDAFGATTAVSFGVVTNIKFTPEGTLVDQDGVSTNGSVFLAMPSDVSSARSITVLGATGRIRAYRWDGRVWRLV
jgi:prepilin-type N-terminal cleavage/methylation domain-containing protein